MEDRARHVEIIDALRAIAVLAVAWFHFTNGGGLLQDGWLKASGGYGWLGVDVFFVISGFTIPLSLYRSHYRFPLHAGRFILKRLIRLHPPYLVAIALSIALWYASAAAPGFRGSAPNLDPMQLLLQLGYLNDIFSYPWSIVVLWSLAIEFQFYLFVAAFFPLMAHPSRGVRLAILAAMCGTAFVMPGDAFAFRFMGLFAFGVLTFMRHAGLMPDRLYLLMLPLLFAATASALGVAIAMSGLVTALVIAFVRLRRSAPIAFLGTISYSIFLLNVPIGGRVVNLGTRFADGTFAQLAVLGAAIGVTIASAYVMYRLVERPAQRWSSSLRYKQPEDRGQAASR